MNKNLNDLLVKRGQKFNTYEALPEDATAEQRKAILDEVESLDAQIDEMKRAEKLAGKNTMERAVEVETNKNDSEAAKFRSYLVEGDYSKPFVIKRADPIITTTNTGVINKTVANEVQIAMSPAESFLKNDLGVKIYDGLNGNFVVPRMDQFSAAFVNEASAAGLGDVNLASLTLAGRRLSAYATITDLTLAQTNPAIFQGIIDDLKNSFWQGVKFDLFDQIEADAASQISDQDAATMTYDVILCMEASLGGLVPSQNLKLVTTPSIKGFAKKTIALGTTAGDSIWDSIDWAKFDSDGANADRIYLGDFSRSAVGIFGDYEVKILQDVENAKKGIYTAVITGLVDTGCALPKAFVIADVSAGL